MLKRPDKSAEVLEFLRRHRLTVADLTEYGGEDFAVLSRRKKAHLVDLAWALMARLGIGFQALEHANPALMPQGD
jgi:hypothetical protein